MICKVRLLRRRGKRLHRGISDEGNTFVGEIGFCGVMHGRELIKRAYLTSKAKGQILTLYEPTLMSINNGFSLRGYENVDDVGYVQEWICDLLTEEEISAFRASEPSAINGAHSSAWGSNG